MAVISPHHNALLPEVSSPVELDGLQFYQGTIRTVKQKTATSGKGVGKRLPLGSAHDEAFRRYLKHVLLRVPAQVQLSELLFDGGTISSETNDFITLDEDVEEKCVLHAVPYVPHAPDSDKAFRCLLKVLESKCFHSYWMEEDIAGR